MLLRKKPPSSPTSGVAPGPLKRHDLLFKLKSGLCLFLLSRRRSGPCEPAVEHLIEPDFTEKKEKKEHL